MSTISNITTIITVVILLLVVVILLLLVLSLDIVKHRIRKKRRACKTKCSQEIRLAGNPS